jgi:hypothetical protein
MTCPSGQPHFIPKAQLVAQAQMRCAHLNPAVVSELAITVSQWYLRTPRSLNMDIDEQPDASAGA